MLKFLLSNELATKIAYIGIKKRENLDLVLQDFMKLLLVSKIIIKKKKKWKHFNCYS